ncbi:MAG: cobalt ECF transporter T component CbiQ [Coriobacteriia bacterium]
MTDHPHSHGAEPPGVHGHEHRHAGQPAHRHPHHHRADAATVPHEHAHPTSFESLSYIVSPVHALDARAKIIGAIVLVVGIVLTSPLRPVEAVLLAALLAVVTVTARLPLGRLLARSAAVLPFAGAIALLAPLGTDGGSWNVAGLVSAWAGGGLAITWGILSKAWVSAFCMLLVAATTRRADLLGALRQLKVPDVFVMLLSFVTRYVTVLGEQLRSLRIAMISRAPHLRGRALLRSLGSIAGNLFVRSYERGERIHAAMVSRGYTGTLPLAAPSRFGLTDVLFVTMAALSAFAVALY